MNLEAMRNFKRSEKVALLKLIIKVAAADNKITGKEQETIKNFLKVNQLKISNGYIKEVMSESYEKIVSLFTDKTNLDRAYSIVNNFAELNGINPDYEGKALDEIKAVLENKKKSIKFSLSNTVKTFFLEFAFLWGKEDLNPNMKSALAITFTILACLIGSIWTYSGFFSTVLGKLSLGWTSTLFPDFGSKTKLVSLQGSHVISGLVIFGALCFRNYLPKPTNFRNLVFSMANLYLLSTIAMQIIGRTKPEKTITVLFSLV